MGWPFWQRTWIFLFQHLSFSGAERDQSQATDSPLTPPLPATWHGPGSRWDPVSTSCDWGIKLGTWLHNPTSTPVTSPANTTSKWSGTHHLLCVPAGIALAHASFYDLSTQSISLKANLENEESACILFSERVCPESGEGVPQPRLWLEG